MNIRKLKQTDMPAAMALMDKRCPWGAKPHLTTLYGTFVGGQLKAIISVQSMMVVESLVAESPIYARDLMMWIDGALNTLPAYIFHVDDRTPEVRQMVERRLPVERLEGEIYVRARDNECDRGDVERAEDIPVR